MACCTFNITKMNLRLDPGVSSVQQTKAWDVFEWYTQVPPAIGLNQDHITVAVTWRMSLYVRIIAWLHYNDHDSPFFPRRVYNSVRAHFPDLFECPAEINPSKYDSVLLDHVGFYLFKMRSGAFPPKLWNILESQLALMRIQKALGGLCDKHIKVVPGAEFPVHNVVNVKWTRALFAVGKRLCMVSKGIASVARAQWPQVIHQYLRDEIFVPNESDSPCMDRRINRIYKRMSSFCKVLRQSPKNPKRILEHPMLASFGRSPQLRDHPVYKRERLKRERDQLKASGDKDTDKAAVLDAQLASADIGIVDIEDLLTQVPPCMTTLIEKTHFSFNERQAVFNLFLSAGVDEQDLLARVKRVNRVKYEGGGAHARQIRGEMRAIQNTFRFYKNTKTKYPRAGPFRCARVQKIGLCSSSREACASRCGKSDMEGPLQFVWQMQGRGIFD